MVNHVIQKGPTICFNKFLILGTKGNNICCIWSKLFRIIPAKAVIWLKRLLRSMVTDRITPALCSRMPPIQVPELFFLSLVVTADLAARIKERCDSLADNYRRLVAKKSGFGCKYKGHRDQGKYSFKACVDWINISECSEKRWKGS